MPLNMNTVGTGNGIGAGSGKETVISSYETTAIDHSTVLDVSSVTFTNKYMTKLYATTWLIGHDESYYYSYYGNYNGGYKLYKHQLTINTNNTTDSSNLKTTQIHDATSDPVIVNGDLYFLTNLTSASLSGELYKFNADKTIPTKIIQKNLDTYYNNHISSGYNWYITSARKINNSNYILYIHEAEEYGYYKKDRFTLIEDNMTTGASVIITSMPYQLTSSDGLNYENTGLVRFRYSNIFGIYDVRYSDEYVDIYVCCTYMGVIGPDYAESVWMNMYFDKVLIRISKSTKVASLTLISSDKIIDNKQIGYDAYNFPLSYPTSETQMVITKAYNHNNNECTGDALIAHITDNPSMKLIENVHPKYSESVYDSEFPNGGSDSRVSTIMYYPCSYAPAIFYGTGSDDGTYVSPISLEMSSAIKNIERITTLSLHKGDLVKSDGNITKYICNGTETTINSTTVNIPTDGMYEFHVESRSNEDPECIVYTKEGTIIGCDITFIDDTHIAGYFNKGMRVNGVKTTKSGYQTLTGTFNGRVTISK